MKAFGEISRRLEPFEAIRSNLEALRPSFLAPKRASKAFLMASGLLKAQKSTESFKIQWGAIEKGSNRFQVRNLHKNCSGRHVKGKKRLKTGVEEQLIAGCDGKVKKLA